MIMQLEKGKIKTKHCMGECQVLLEELPTGIAANSVLIQMYSPRRAVMIMATRFVSHHAHEWGRPP